MAFSTPRPFPWLFIEIDVFVSDLVDLNLVTSGQREVRRPAGRSPIDLREVDRDLQLRHYSTSGAATLIALLSQVLDSEPEASADINASLRCPSAAL